MMTATDTFLHGPVHAGRATRGVVDERVRSARLRPRLQLRPGPDPRPGVPRLPLRRSADLLRLPPPRPLLRAPRPVPAPGAPCGADRPPGRGRPGARAC